MSKRKYIIKFLLIITIIQVLLASVGALLIYESKPIRKEETETIIVKVEETKYERRLVSEYRFSVISNSIEYQFDERGAFSEYSNIELNEAIKIGDELSITYYKNLWGKKKVVDARSASVIYRSFECYNSQRAFAFSIVFFAVLEIVFIAFTVVFVMLNRKKFKTKK
ncbi:MAG: hypothetical protein IJ400_04245 [Clostridia bacterium]|nr:hypothetical protein [Clostridia bacterium]